MKLTVRTATRMVGLLAVAGLLGLGAAPAAAQETDVGGLVKRGEASYRTHCASCHGAEARGDGVVAVYMKSPPPDLTEINARNQGEFPFETVYEMIDGRDVPGHGTRAMPVWGPAFMGMEENPDKKVVKERVVELVYYLKSIQTPVLEANPKMGGAGG